MSSVQTKALVLGEVKELFVMTGLGSCRARIGTHRGCLLFAVPKPKGQGLNLKNEGFVIGLEILRVRKGVERRQCFFLLLPEKTLNLTFQNTR